MTEQNIREQLGDSGGWKKKALGAIEANKRVGILEKRANTDKVTGLENEYPLGDMINGLQSRFEKDYKKGKYLKGTFIVLDLTGLHAINHNYGKLKGGNDFLKAVGESLTDISRKEVGRCFRNGKESDEFTLYLPETVLEEQITSVLDQIDKSLKEKQEVNQSTYPGILFGVSYCVASFHRGYGPADAFADAENMMGKAKERDPNGERVGNIGRLFVNRLDRQALQNE